MDSHSLDNSFVRGKQHGQGSEAASTISEKVARMSLRECTAYETQLRSLLDAAVAKPPPRGVATAEVEHRMRLLQMALEEVQEHSAELRQAKEARERERYLSTQLRRTEAEEEAERSRALEDKHRKELVEEMREAQVAYFKDRNGYSDDKAEQCREYNERMQIETMSKATANEDRRERNLATLMAERERQRQALRAKDLAQQQSIKEANQRKASRQEAERREKERLAAIHEQEMEAKLAAIRDSKRSKWVAKRKASRAKSSVVFKKGQAILETEVKDHAKLVEDLETKVKGQQARYADERAEQLLYLQQRAQHRSMREDRQQANLIRLIDKRLARGEVIVEGAKEKKERAEHTKDIQATQYLEHGIELRKDLAHHRKRANAVQWQRDNEALTKNYRRWNHRAARIIAELNEAVEQDAAAQQQATTTTGNGGNGSNGYSNRDAQATQAAPSSSSRLNRLPSPSDFSV